MFIISLESWIELEKHTAKSSGVYVLYNNGLPDQPIIAHVGP